MKLNKIGQVSFIVAACVGAGLLLASCNPSATIDYVFVTSVNGPGPCQSGGCVSSYHVESETGALAEVAGSPVSSLGNNPVAEVASPNGAYLYVANEGSNNIAQFNIGTNGQLVAGKTYTTPGSEPISVAMNSAGTLLFVLDYYAPGFSDASPGPGGLAVYPINADGSLGTPVSSGGSSITDVQCFPGGVVVSASGAYAYVTNTNSVVVTTSSPTTSTPPSTPAACPTQGTISGFAIGSTGALAPLPGSPYLAGTTPTGIAIDPTNRFVYATDSVQNQLIVYDVQSNGSLLPLNNGPFDTGTFPVDVTVDPRGLYLYVSNYNGSTISEYSINQGTGAPSGLAAATADYATKAPNPTCLVVEPALGHFLYVSDFSTPPYVSGADLNPDSGALTGIQDQPYPAHGFPTCITAVPHGNHATQYVSPSPGQ
jgi:6-phosphogluconolactonase